MEEIKQRAEGWKEFYQQGNFDSYVLAKKANGIISALLASLSRLEEEKQWTCLSHQGMSQPTLCPWCKIKRLEESLEITESLELARLEGKAAGRREVAEEISDMAINIVLDDTNPQAPLFVEIENDKGESISIGDIRIEGQYTYLRVSVNNIVQNKGI